MDTMASSARPRAYSYVRFSTPEQANGDSIERQTKAARAWAAGRGLELDEELTFRDVRIPMKPAMHSNWKPAMCSDAKPVAIPI